MTQITIIGGGVAGLCVARSLRDRGADVRVIDRHGALGPHACSWWAGGMLAPFCEGENAEEPVVRLGQEAADWWDAKTHAVNRCGTLVISPTRDKAELIRFGRRTSNFETISGADIDVLEPDLAGRFNTGLLFKDEAHLSPRLALSHLRDGLIADGVTFETADADPEVYARGGLTVDCRGFQARDTITDLRGVKGEMLILSCKDVTLNRPVRLLHPRIPLYVVPRGDGIFMLGATMIESSQKSHVTARSLLELLSAAYALNPAFGEAEVLEIGVDARPAFPDNLPRIRRNGNLIRANGLFRHGFLLAPAMARMVAEMIFDNTRPEMMDEASA
ncbi:FAD-dependent oxidoreductase [Ahrensia kielensis]|uniref:FAD-dependent oxidoreductase n=1 Tax=Ahrensia kielensis TaxID=76980 RepID=A0ABU9T5A9_9HYPH